MLVIVPNRFEDTVVATGMYTSSSTSRWAIKPADKSVVEVHNMYFELNISHIHRVSKSAAFLMIIMTHLTGIPTLLSYKEGLLVMDLALYMV
jgi:hypothetical protein